MIESVTAFLGKFHPALSALSGIPLAVFLLVAAFTVTFIVGYLWQGFRVGFQLWGAERSIRKLAADNDAVGLEEVAAVLKKEPLKHLWDEYADTVHPFQKASGQNGPIVEMRATVPAEVYFTREVLVDSRMFDDFVRHLPGVLTGLGIIGTFAGLLTGLTHFNPTNTSTAVAGLKPLLDGVAHAFVASAFAISCAMVVVFIEKLMLALFYRKVEQLNHTIDKLYRMGAGETYLARLTQSAENSEMHAAQLKDGLLNELKEIMTNLADRQIAANQQGTQALGQQIGQAITESLQKPMQDIGDAVKRASGEQGTAVQGLLEDVLTAFMSKLEDTFGGQMKGINESMEHSMGAMANVQTALQNLLQNIERSTETATSQMSAKLEDTMKQAAANQELMTEQMREFVQEFRKLIADEQNKSRQIMDEAVTNVLTQLSVAMEHLKQERQASQQEESHRQVQMKERATELVGGLSEQVDTLVKAVTEQVDKTQRNIDAISAVSTRAIDGMNQGAMTMGTAAQRFETAGNAVSTVFEQSKAVTDQLHTASTSLQSAATAVRQGFEQYDNTRKVVENHVNALTALIENARREAGMTKEILSDLERILQQLRAAEEQSYQYLEKVNEALRHTFVDFGTQMSNQVANTIKQTDSHLSSGVSHLSGVVQELETALSRMRRAN